MASSFPKVSVHGLGYIGLPTAAVLASRGLRVVGIDVQENVVETINQGRIHIAEPGLEELVAEVVARGLLRATKKAEAADVFFIAVPTPFKSGHEPDLSFVENTCRAIAPVLKKGDLVILESTSPVGATERVAGWLAGARPDLSFPQQRGEDSDIRIAYCPERVLPGRILRELVENDRVIGGMTPRCFEAAVEVYRLFVSGECVQTGARTAELCKLAENSFRDVNIAFANELSLICDRLDIDVWELIRLANRHPRVNILRPGCGVGGHCIAVDPWFIISEDPVEARLISTARKVNDDKPLWVIAKVDEAVEAVGCQGKALDAVRIACFGLAFKPDVDDLRESPALQIVTALQKKYARQMVATDPFVTSAPPGIADVPLVSLEEAVKGADVLVFLTAHTAFRSLDRENLPSGSRIIDAAGLFAPPGRSS